MLMAASLLVYILYRDRRYGMGLGRTPLKPDLGRMGKLIRLGAPAAMQIALEVGVFAVATTLIGRLGANVIAAHQIALNAASVTFMVPLGIGAAAAVRVGQALGRGDKAAASRSGWRATVLGAGFMGCAAVAFLAAPGALIRPSTADEDVLD